MRGYSIAFVAPCMAKRHSTPKRAYVNAASAAPNSGKPKPMSFALRENRTLFSLIAVWGLVTALATVTGPFGTLGVLTPLPRFAYWACVVAVSVLGSHLVFMASESRTLLVNGLIWGLFILCTTSLVYLLNMLVFDGWRGVMLYLYLFGVVTVIVLIVHGAMALVDAMRPETVNSPDNPTATFLARIPLVQRGALIRIEAQDHYLNVVTDKDSSLILLRLNEAVKELEQARGLQVHRSH